MLKGSTEAILQKLVKEKASNTDSTKKPNPMTTVPPSSGYTFTPRFGSFDVHKTVGGPHLGDIMVLANLVMNAQGVVSYFKVDRQGNQKQLKDIDGAPTSAYNVGEVDILVVTAEGDDEYDSSSFVFTLSPVSH